AALIADVKMITDCQKIVLGGSVGLAPGYIDLVRDILKKQPEIYNISISPARYNHNAGIIGAALFLHQHNAVI
ncbi:ROK family protein, partial [Escherichia coli O128:H42]|nr:ROK family protein [Escherichia coli O128:H42]EFA4218809.1 ROK family protein [Escherichia coli O19:H42]